MSESKRRARRRGSIKQRAKGAWLVRVTLATDSVTGRQFRRAKVVHGSKADAERYLTECLRRSDAGEQEAEQAVRRQSFGQWLEEFWSVWSGDLAEHTKQKNIENLKLYLPDHMLATRLTALTSRMIQEFFNELMQRVSWPTASYTFRLMRARLNDAVTHGRLASNPMDRVALPRKPHTEIRTLTPAEARQFLEAAEQDRFGVLWSLLLLTGLRPSEGLALKWSDINGGSLAVRRSLVRLRGQQGASWRFEDTKGRRERVVALPELALALLNRHRQRQARERIAAGPVYAQHDLIFATRIGSPLSLNTEVPRHFKKVLKAAGLPDMRCYDLRHSAATLLLAAGEHPKVVQERLGHASITLTLDTYTHVQPDMQRQAAERIDTLLGYSRRKSSAS